MHILEKRLAIERAEWAVPYPREFVFDYHEEEKAGTVINDGYEAGKLLNRIVLKNSKRIRTLLSRVWGQIRSEISSRDITSTRFSGEVEHEIESAYSNFVNNNLAPIWLKAILSAAKYMKREMGGTKSVSAEEILEGWEWSGGYAALREWIDTSAGSKITLFTQTEIESFRAALSIWMMQSPIPLIGSKDSISGILKNTVGLLPRYQSAIAKYAANLAENGASQATIERAIARESRRLLKSRAETIARTEISTAWNQGIIESVRAGVKDGDIIGEMYKRWSTGKDELVCEICGPLDRQMRHIDDPFDSGDLMPPAHINCRCCVSFVSFIPGVDKDPPPRVN